MQPTSPESEQMHLFGDNPDEIRIETKPLSGPIENKISSVYADTVGIPEPEPKIETEEDFAQRWGYVPSELELQVAKGELNPGSFSETDADELLGMFHQARMKRSMIINSQSHVTVLSDTPLDVTEIFEELLTPKEQDELISKLNIEQKQQLSELTSQRMKFVAKILWADRKEKIYPGGGNERILKGERKRWKGYAQENKPWWVRDRGIIRDIKEILGIF